MKFPSMPRKKASTIANGVLLIGIGLLFFFDAWWPGILFVLGISIALKQYLTGRRQDFYITLSILTAILIVSIITFSPSMLLSLVFIAMGTYLIAREYFLKNSESFSNHSEFK